ncbi:MAG TPA: SPOR domain-containing protein [Casimicrobiaceae bacterium]|nr:SPOR domain-containing protein [Casimicrobiaceae bacterium]
MTALKQSRRPSVARTPHPHSAFGGTLLGVFIGIVVGLGMAASVAYYLMKNNPALPMPRLSRDAQESSRDDAKAARNDEKPRFDFYKILPGIEEPKVQPAASADRGDRAVVEQAKDRASDKSMIAAVAPPRGAMPADVAAKPVAKPPDRFWLQAGSFTTAPDAENLRARLALAGWEASVQQGSLPDNSVRYRVRLGPYDNADELGRMKSELAKRGFDVAVIRY